MLRLARALRGAVGKCPVLAVEPKQRRMYPLNIMYGGAHQTPNVGVTQGGWYIGWGMFWGYYYWFIFYAQYASSMNPDVRFDGSQFTGQRLFFGSRYDEPAEWVRVLPLSPEAPK
ncbi:unnamed protein product [Amoebophrya sp. A120]|nr:unnamed protein product [Amoebophrya sp. A120]|eukprot:GSA120T00014859001.1